ncbi:MAG: DUF4296 domain-containing protein [Bacteroidales bacterium]|nr:DUF4296 domain-containing protein [Bacteroidales bacterium]
MNFRILSFCLSLIIITSFGCIQKKAISGKEFIPREVLVDMLVDIHLMDGVSNDRKFYRRFTDVDSIDLLSPILQKHQVSFEMFDTTLFEYSRHPDLFDQVYNDVLMKLNVMLDENENEAAE